MFKKPIFDKLMDRNASAGFVFVRKAIEYLHIVIFEKL